jgi:radical SAM protein
MSVVSTKQAQPSHNRPRDLARNPMIVYWEMTQACGLACRHCRAEAMLQKHPNELNHTESRALLQQIRAFGDPLPHLILTGGDPLRRPDLYELIDEAVSLGLEASITPAATQSLTRDVVAELHAHAISSLGLSLDGSNADKHEAVRGVPGCFDWTMDASRYAAEVDMPIQVNTLVAAETADDLPAIFDLLLAHRVMRWSLFFLIGVGRGRMLEPVSPERGEQVMRWSLELARSAPFAIKTTEAPSYRRIALEQMRASNMPLEAMRRSSVLRGFGIRDGNGIVFVSNTGDICPAGFLPLALGNVRNNELAKVYRNESTFRALHDANAFKGKCGECEYRIICGGSRARAFAATGDPLESDPLCPYQPVRGAREVLQ